MTAFHSRVPYGFARSQRVLLIGVEGELGQAVAEVWIDPSTRLAGLAELARMVPMRLRTVRKTPEEFNAALARTFSH
jgi:hypothetical protein